MDRGFLNQGFLVCQDKVGIWWSRW